MAPICLNFITYRIFQRIRWSWLKYILGEIGKQSFYSEVKLNEYCSLSLKSYILAPPNGILIKWASYMDQTLQTVFKAAQSNQQKFVLKGIPILKWCF